MSYKDINKKYKKILQEDSKRKQEEYTEELNEILKEGKEFMWRVMKTWEIKAKTAADAVEKTKKMKHDEVKATKIG